MVKILTEISNEFAAARKLSNEAQSQLLSVQDILARATNQCYQAQQKDVHYKSFADGIFHFASSAGTFAAALVNAKGKLNPLGKSLTNAIPVIKNLVLYRAFPPLMEAFSKVGQSGSQFYFEPRKLDHDNLMRKTDSLNQQTSRQVTALDELKRNLDSMEQQLQQQRQSAASV